ncbi:MAG: phosphotransferase [Brevefilum sp.]|nr:phosphotransferase [Brevefilum sp.]
MQKDDFIQKLVNYYINSGLLNPQIYLDRVIYTGWESEIYLFTLKSGTESDRIVVRRALRLLTGANFSEAEAEFKTLGLLGKAGYPVPQVYALGRPDEAFGRPFIIMQSVQGGNFANRFPKTTGDDQKPLDDFIALFRRLHTLDWRLYIENPDAINPPGQPYYHFDRQLEIFSGYFSRADFTGLDPAMAWLIAQRERAACEHASVIHYDFHPDNILEDGEGKLYVVDWTSADISDYRFDLAWTLTLALAYRGVDRRLMILKEYERQMGDKVPELDVFEAAAIVRRIGFVMLSLGAGADKMGMRPEAAEAMRRDKLPLTRIFGRLQEITSLDFPEVQAFLDSL